MARKRPAGVTVPLVVRIVGRTAGALALLGVASFIADMVLIGIGTASHEGGMAEGPLKFVALWVLLPIMGGAIVFSILLALLNALGVKIWFDEKTGHFRRPIGTKDWAMHFGSLAAGLGLPVTIIALAVGLLVMYQTGVDPDDMSGLLIGILLGGVGATVGIAGIVGGVVIMGWFGVVAGLLIGAGFVGVVSGQTTGTPTDFVLGCIAIAFAAATYYAGGRLSGVIPQSFAHLAATGGYLTLGISFLIQAAITGNGTMVVGGVAGIASTIGWFIGGVLQRRRARISPPVQDANAARHSNSRHP
jgi:hypothetical protein